MNENKIALPDIFYISYLKKIHGVNFTQREVDIISCLLSGRASKKTASFLNISPRTVETHVRNITKKLDCNSREDIIDFIENSDEYIPLKIYYSNLLTYQAFEGILNDLSKTSHEKAEIYIHCQELKENELQIIHQIQRHLSLFHVHTSLVENNQSSPLEKTTLWASSTSQGLVLSFEHHEVRNSTPNNGVFFEFYHNYYFSFFELLAKIFPHKDLSPYLSKFKDLCNKNRYALEQKHTEEISQTKVSLSPWHTQLFLPKTLLRHKKKFLWATSLFTLFLLNSSFLFLGSKENKFSLINNTPLVHSDLLLPKDSVFLPRPELTALIDDKFKQGNGIRAVALVGTGGAGKSTLARQYVRQQNPYIVWEINAETKNSIKASFENLAYTLAITEEDKKLLSRLEDIKEATVKEDKIIQFVKDQLKLHSNWFLIYDNVENFADIQKYFPRDIKTWGYGKVILTTRDGNIQNNEYINNTIYMGELSPPQKLFLFEKIMMEENKIYGHTATPKEIDQFLEHIPPFPLDVSVAAYYLKTTNIPYKVYLENLTKNNQDVSNIQEDLLKEAGGYIKTRYNIITLSLQHLLETDPHFRDLLLLICLLDSQNIPRDLLDSYESPLIIDKFIYHLKKYSLVTNESSSSRQFVPAFSIHRSTQGIGLVYLTKALDSETKMQSLSRITQTLEKYIEKTTRNQDLVKMRLLISHGKKFTSHTKLVPEDLKNTINCELGTLYFYSGSYDKAKPFLEEACFKINQEKPQNSHKIAHNMECLGIVYKNLGDYEKSKKLLENSLTRYQKHLPPEHIDIIRVLTILGFTNRVIGNYGVAKSTLENAKMLLDQNLKTPESKMLESYNSVPWILLHLGITHLESGNYVEAKKLIEESLAIYKKSTLKNPLGLALSLSQLGNVYGVLGDYDKAKKLLEQSQKIYKENLPENHIDVAWGLAFLGNVYKGSKEYAKAEEVLNKSLRIYKETLPESHIFIAWGLSNLGELNKEMGRYEKAIDFFEQSIRIYEKNYGKDHIDSAPFIAGLGRVYLAQDRLELAETTIMRALKIFQQKNINAYKCLEGLSDLSLKKAQEAHENKDFVSYQRMKDRAITYLTQTLETMNTYFPKDAPHVERVRAKLDKLRNE
jgi:tetratricopeptide (TPR) repeat protein